MWHKDADAGGEVLVKVGDLGFCIVYFPLRPVTSVAANKIKAYVEMGHRPTSCVFVECMLRDCVCVRVSTSQRPHMRLRALSGGRGAALVCVCEGPCVLECGLTFAFDTTGSIDSPHRKTVTLSSESRQGRKCTLVWPAGVQVLFLFCVKHESSPK